MKVESRNTVNPRGGIARNWRIGSIHIEWYVVRPPQSWIKFALTPTEESNTTAFFRRKKSRV